MAIQTRLINAQDPQAVAQAIEELDRDGMVAFPTDTVYGLGARAFSSRGIEALYAAKGRENTKAIAVLLGDLSQLDLVTDELGETARRLADRFWPGPLTLVVSRHPDLPSGLSPLPTVGVRIPDHPFARALLRASGPLATTSANLSGFENPLSAQDVLSQLEGIIPLVIDGGRTPGGVPSTVIDCTAPEPKILRAGPISMAALKEILEG